MKILNKLLFCLVFLCCGTLVNAHEGGHHQYSDSPTLRHWQQRADDGKLIIGNYKMSKDNLVYIEGINGFVWAINYSLLTGADKAYTDQEISRIKLLNRNFSKSGFDNNMGNWWMTGLGMVLFLIALLVGIIYAVSFFGRQGQFAVKWGVLSFTMFIAAVLFIVACKKQSVSDGISTTTIAKSDPSVLATAFALFKSTVTTRWDNNYLYVESNSIPAQNLMVGITSWQQQVPIPQPYTGTNAWSIPLQPQFSDSPLSLTSNFMMGAVAIAVNGIPIFNALNNRGEDSNLIGELDAFGGHCGKADDYHYHVAPMHLQTTVGNSPIAIAFDGFSAYGSKEPDGTVMQTLDASHGHMYNGVYHYHGTSNYPYLIASMKGKVALDPNTTAPQNQIIPQAFTKPFRPAGTPLSGATITGYSVTGTNAYLLTYQIAGKNGSYRYNWDNSGNYTFVITDVNGNATTTSYKR